MTGADTPRATDEHAQVVARRLAAIWPQRGGVSAARLAAALPVTVSRQYLADLRSGRRVHPRADVLSALAEHFGIGLDELMPAARTPGRRKTDRDPEPRIMEIFRALPGPEQDLLTAIAEAIWSQRGSRGQPPAGRRDDDGEYAVDAD